MEGEVQVSEESQELAQVIELLSKASSKSRGRNLSPGQVETLIEGFGHIVEANLAAYQYIQQLEELVPKRKRSALWTPEGE